MHFISTRNKNLSKTVSEAIRLGLAENGGLFMPERMPTLELDSFTDELTYPLFAEKILRHFFAEDLLQENLLTLCQNAFSFPVPLTQLSHNTFMLELFHGPTSSFKDFGARFLAECLNRISSQQKTTILVATSGDTGSAVASAFYGKSNSNVVILYPKGQISARQEQQITCWGQNILALAVHGTFDDCQQLVKAAFKDQAWQKQFNLSSANSINIGRLLPQMVYYAYSSLHFYRQYQVAPGYIIPTGNLGNATAGYFAKSLGFPIREIVLATNANRVISDYLQSGEYMPRPSITTLANAMDVGNPSNFERLQYLFNTFTAFKKNVTAWSVSDTDIIHTIKSIYQHHDIIICPHTATAFFVRNKLSAQPWIITATASAGKFDTIIEPLIEKKVPIEPQLQALLERPACVVEVAKKLAAIKKAMLNYWRLN